MAQTKPPKWRKVAISAAVGAVLGVLGMMALDPLLDSGALGSAGASELIAATVGLLYLVMALCIAVGVASPGLGARFLNMEDADELRDQRRLLAYAASSMVAMGGALIVLALASPGGVVPQPTALLVAVALFGASVPLTFLQWRHMDELMRNVSNEAGNLAFHLLLLAGGGWAMLAHLGFARAPATLDWLSMFFGLVLLAAFIATARRGMLVPH
ncbi:hypothetical protein [Luteimonas saliphila]|uniref:hypothetical protein n=1 Tax=Luteimonas saliphila TaxID=2804919 RepID=UPI00192DB3C3|nr:hypothetical protein [Luteimonas saliphila]